MDMKKYTGILRKSGIKVTPQRLEVLRYLDQNMVHPTVDDIFTALKKTNPSLSRTTVYNVLDVFGKHGLVEVLTISGNQTRYDLRTRQHQHFLCKSCGKILDLEVKGLCTDCIPDRGHRVEEVHGYFKGLCKDCLKRTRS